VGSIPGFEERALMADWEGNTWREAGKGKKRGIADRGAKHPSGKNQKNRGKKKKAGGSKQKTHEG